MSMSDRSTTVTHRVQVNELRLGVRVYHERKGLLVFALSKYARVCAVGTHISSFDYTRMVSC